MEPTCHTAETTLLWAGQQNPGNWIEHSRFVALACKNIAAQCEDLSAEQAYCFGLLHDIGRYAGVSSERHLIDGYRFCMERGWEKAAQICISHAFMIQDIHRNAASRRDGCGNGECLGTAESGGRRSVRRRRTGWDLSLLSGAGPAVGDGCGRCSGQICANRSSSTASARFGGNGQLWAAGRDCAGALVSNQKVLPSPTWLCTPKRKPWLCRMALVMDSPSPVPTLPASLRLR